jgi:hypothetical protein
VVSEEDMTKKHDLKRRVRDRQAQTGESYTAARRQVIGEADVPDGPDEATSDSKVPVFELVDATEPAAKLGFKCRILMFPSLVEAVAPGVVLDTLHKLLVTTTGDPETARIWSVAIGGFERPRGRVAVRSLEATQRFLARAQAGLGGASEDGSMLAIHVAGKGGVVPVLCTHWPHKTALVLAVIDGTDTELWPINTLVGRMRDLPPLPPLPLLPPLYVILDGRRHPITQDHFVIGRDRNKVALAIRDGTVSREHAVVLFRNGIYYLKDLTSTLGIAYKGMRIDNKRIEEGDVFHLGDHELRFTFRPDDAPTF